jgi:hypothetical protein
MEDDMELIDYHLERILPTLVKLGYSMPVRRFKKNDLLLRAEIAHEKKADWMGGSVELYGRDAYPVTSKEEAVLHVWTWAGSPSKFECRKIADALTRAGIPARHTTYQKNDVVAFDAGDWLSQCTTHSRRAEASA